MLQTLLSLSMQDSDFNFILLVFLTEYEDELPFFEHEDEGGERKTQYLLPSRNQR